MDDDFNTREAIATLFSLFSEANKNRENRELVAGYIRVAEEIADVLGINLWSAHTGGKEKELVQILLDIRKQARENKDWATSDMIRDRLKEIGIIVEDSKEGQKVRWE
jgi:cysteinyl-tRNA synthetase